MPPKVNRSSRPRMGDAAFSSGATVRLAGGRETWTRTASRTTETSWTSIHHLRHQRRLTGRTRYTLRARTTTSSSREADRRWIGSGLPPNRAVTTAPRPMSRTTDWDRCCVWRAHSTPRQPWIRPECRPGHALHQSTGALTHRAHLSDQETVSGADCALISSLLPSLRILL